MGFLLLFCFFSLLITALGKLGSDIISSTIHVNNFGRYASCPFLSEHNYEFACFLLDPTKGERICSNTRTNIVDMREALPKLTNHSLLFVGDSLVRNQFVSFACLLWEADDTISTSDIDTPSERDPLPHVFSIRSPKYNLEVRQVFVGLILDIQEKQLSAGIEHVSKLVLPKYVTELLKGTFKQAKIHNSDVPRAPTILMLSTGHHWDLVKYSNESLPNIRVDQNLFKVAVDRINSRLMHDKLPNQRVIWRGVPPRHYSMGEWNSGGHCDDYLPMNKTKLNNMLLSNTSSYVTVVFLSKVIEKSVNMINNKINSSGFEYLDISTESYLRSDAQIGNTHTGFHGTNADCSHYCVPGVPDAWNTFLIDRIQKIPWRPVAPAKHPLA